MGGVNLGELIMGFKNKKFCELIERHIRAVKGNTKKLQNAVLETALLLPPEARTLVEDFIDKWISRAYDQWFWQQDADIVFCNIVEHAGNLLAKHKIKTNDEVLFNMFQIIVLSYANSASDQPNMQEFIGIKKERLS